MTMPKAFYFWYFTDCLNRVSDQMGEEVLGRVFGVGEEEAEAHYRAFTGFYEGVIEAADGYVDDPGVVELGDLGLTVECHPGDMILKRNGTDIGSCGPHWYFPQFSDQELQQLADSAGLLVLLPFLMQAREDYLLSLSGRIQDRLQQMGLGPDRQQAFLGEWFRVVKSVAELK